MRCSFLLARFKRDSFYALDPYIRLDRLNECLFAGVPKRQLQRLDCFPRHFQRPVGRNSCRTVKLVYYTRFWPVDMSSTVFTNLDATRAPPTQVNSSGLTPTEMLPITMLPITMLPAKMLATKMLHTKVFPIKVFPANVFPIDVLALLTGRAVHRCKAWLSRARRQLVGEVRSPCLRHLQS